MLHPNHYATTLNSAMNHKEQLAIAAAVAAAATASSTTATSTTATSHSTQVETNATATTNAAAAAAPTSAAPAIPAAAFEPTTSMIGTLLEVNAAGVACMRDGREDEALFLFEQGLNACNVEIKHLFAHNTAILTRLASKQVGATFQITRSLPLKIAESSCNHVLNTVETTTTEQQQQQPPATQPSPLPQTSFAAPSPPSPAPATEQVPPPPQQQPPSSNQQAEQQQQQQRIRAQQQQQQQEVHDNTYKLYDRALLFGPTTMNAFIATSTTTTTSMEQWTRIVAHHIAPVLLYNVALLVHKRATTSADCYMAHEVYRMSLFLMEENTMQGLYHKAFDALLLALFNNLCELNCSFYQQDRVALCREKLLLVFLNADLSQIRGEDYAFFYEELVFSVDRYAPTAAPAA